MACIGRRIGQLSRTLQNSTRSGYLGVKLNTFTIKGPVEILIILGLLQLCQIAQDISAVGEKKQQFLEGKGEFYSLCFVPVETQQIRKLIKEALFSSVLFDKRHCHSPNAFQ